MLIAARLIGILIIAMGSIIALNPKVFKSVINFWKQGRKAYLAGALRIGFGIIFLLIAPKCRLPAAMYTLGVLMVIGGVVIFLLGPARIQAVLSWWERKPPIILRLAGLLALTIGGLILYSV